MSKILGVHNNQINYALSSFLNIENKNPFDSATLLLFNKHLV